MLLGRMHHVAQQQRVTADDDDEIGILGDDGDLFVEHDIRDMGIG